MCSLWVFKCVWSNQIKADTCVKVIWSQAKPEHSLFEPDARTEMVEGLGSPVYTGCIKKKWTVWKMTLN